MSQIDIDELSERLRDLPLEQPDPKAVTLRVLAASRSESTRREWSMPRPVRPLAAAVAALVVAWAVLYFAPATTVALADAPGVGSVSSFVLGAAGLGNGGAVVSESDTAAHTGVRVQLIGISANPIHTVVLLKLSPAGAVPSYATLNDQFGGSYEYRGGFSDLRTGDSAEIFSPPSGVDAALGMRFTITISVLGSDRKALPGTWTVHGIALSHSGITIAPPQPGSAGGASVSFSGGRASDGIIELPVRVRGVTLDQLGISTKQQPGEAPPLNIQVVDKNGKALESTYDLAPDNDGISVTVYAYGSAAHGSYTVRITMLGSELERSISF